MFFNHPIRFVLFIEAKRRGRSLLHQFEQECRHVQRTQARVLSEILARQADSEMGRARSYASIGSPDEFRKRVPLTDYETMRPWVNKMRDTGDPRVMFGPKEKLLMYALTSGSDSEPKHIPVTAESHYRYRQGWMTWVAGAVADHPQCFHHQVLPVVSPAVEARTPLGVPCGAMSGLSTETQSKFVKTLYAIPPGVYGLSNQADKYYALARLGAGCRVCLLVTANPSSFLMLAQTMDAHREKIIRDVHDGTLSIDLAAAEPRVRDMAAHLKPHPHRARFLERISSRTGHLRPINVWPELALLTNWKGGTLSHYLDLYPEHYGNTPVRDIGLIASEGRMTIPLEDEGAAGPLDLNSHFFEFLPLEEENSPQPTLLMAHELEIGRKYFIYLTNFSGLHRYAVSDVVQVEGFFRRCPVIKFLHKGSRFSSITGEKLSEHQVTISVRSAAAELNLHLCDFLMLPVWGRPPCYALIAAAKSLGAREQWVRLIERVDDHLQRHNIEYASKRKSERLGPVRLGIVEETLFGDMRLERIATSGGRSEQYKPTYLTADLEFHKGLDVLEEIAVGGAQEGEPLLRR